MGLYQSAPPMSGRMGALWTLAGIRDAAVVEYGCMGHMAYGRTFLHQMGLHGARLYSTHINETDIAMGNTERLNHAICQIGEKEKVGTFFLLPSSVPQVIGTDLEAIGMELSMQHPNLRFFPIKSGNFGTCIHTGVEQTLLQLADIFPQQEKSREKTGYNIIGSCADIFRFGADAAEVARMVEGAFGLRPVCVMTSDCSIESFEKMGCARINLIIRREGEAAAKKLQERFGTPYLVARPYGISQSILWLNKMADVLKTPADNTFIERETAQTQEQLLPMQTLLNRFLPAHAAEAKLTLAGHADVVEGMASFVQELFSFNTISTYCNCTHMAAPGMPYLDDETKQQIAREAQGFLLADAELLQMASRNKALQIANPDNAWRHPYEPPLMGFRGAVNIAAILANELPNRD